MLVSQGELGFLKPCLGCGWGDSHVRSLWCLSEFKAQGIFSILVHAPHSDSVIVTPTIGSVIHADRWVGGGRASLVDSPFVFPCGFYMAHVFVIQYVALLHLLEFRSWTLSTQRVGRRAWSLRDLASGNFWEEFFLPLLTVRGTVRIFSFL